MRQMLCPATPLLRAALTPALLTAVTTPTPSSPNPGPTFIHPYINTRYHPKLYTYVNIAKQGPRLKRRLLCPPSVYQPSVSPP